MLDLGTLGLRLEVNDNGSTNALKNYGTQAEDADKKSLGLKGSLKQLAGGFAIGFAIKEVATGLIDCGKSAVEFETSFAQVSTLLDESKTDFGEYKDAILDASNETGVAVGELSESVYGSISAGVDASKAVEFTANSVKLAKGGFTDTAKAVDVMTTAINGYGLSADDATKVSDMLIVTQNAGKTTVDELASSMGAVIPVASGANFAMDELSTSYAVLTKNGIATSEAGTYLKGMLGELTKNGSITDKTLRELSGKGFAELKESGMSTTDILGMLSDSAEGSGKSLKDMFGSSEAGSAAMVLMKGDGKEYNEILNQMQNSAGATGDAFEKMAATPEEKMAMLKNSLHNMSIQIGEVLLPIVMSIASFVSEHMPEIQAVVEGVLGVITALLGSLGTAISALVTSAQTDGTYFNAVWKEVQIVFTTVFKALQDIFAIFTALFKGDWETTWNGIKTLFSDIWEGMKLLFQNNLDAIVNIFTGMGEAFKNAGKALLDKVKEGFVTVWKSITTWITTSFNGMVKSIKGFGTLMFEAGKSIITNVWDGMKDIWKNVSTWIIDRAKDIADTLMFWKDSEDEKDEIKNSKKDGSHRTGLDVVPFDDYNAILHKGEKVLAQPEADRYRKGENGKGNNSGDFTINIEKVENSNGRSVMDFLKEAEFYRKSKQLAVGGV